MQAGGKPGVIINIASASGLYPMYRGPIYSGSKGMSVLFVYIVGVHLKFKLSELALCVFCFVHVFCLDVQLTSIVCNLYTIFL